jgi:hypothetical protein
MPRPELVQPPPHDLAQPALDAVPAGRLANPAADRKRETAAGPWLGLRVNVEHKEWMVPPATFLPDIGNII